MRTKASKCRLRVSAVLLIVLVLITLVDTFACGQAPASERSLFAPSIATPTVSTPVNPITQLPRISAREVKQKIDSGVDITIADVRSKTAFAKSHIVNSISIPLGGLEERYHELRKESEIITV